MLFKVVQATIRGNGYWLLPICEQIHSLLNIAPIKVKMPILSPRKRVVLKVPVHIVRIIGKLSQGPTSINILKLWISH